MQKSFWHSWFKLVLMLILVLGIWIGVLFLGTRFFRETFERNKIIHYMLLMLMVIKAKDIFLKEIGQDKKDSKDNKQEENILENENQEK